MQKSVTPPRTNAAPPRRTMRSRGRRTLWASLLVCWLPLPLASSEPTSADGDIQVLFIAGSANAPTGDVPLVDRLSARSIDVVVVDDHQLQVETVDSYDFVWISGSASPSVVGTQMTDVPVPIGTNEAFLYDELLMGSTSGHAFPNRMIEVVDGQAFNEIEVTTRDRGRTWADVSDAASVSAIIPGQPDRASVFVYGEGATLIDGSVTPSCRAGFFADAQAPLHLTPAGFDLFDLVVDELLACSPNSAPVLDPIGPITVTEGDDVSIHVTAHDPDNDTLTFSATGLPTGVTVSPATGHITGTLSVDAANTSPYPVVITVADPDAATDSQTFEFHVQPGPNQPPTLQPIDDQHTTPGNNVTITIDATDPDGEALTFDATGLPTGITLDPDTGIITGTTPPYEPPTTITITATDPHAATATTTFTWTINQPPAITAIEPQTNTEGDTIHLDIDATDPDNEPITLSATGLPPDLNIDHDTNAITGTISSHATTTGDTYTATITATDPHRATSHISFDWTIQPGPNQPPTLQPIDDQHATVGDTLVIPISAADPDDGDDVTLSAAGLPPDLFVDAASNTITGSIGGTAGTTYLVEVEARDASGETASETFALSVNRRPARDVLFVSGKPTPAIGDQTIIDRIAARGITVETLDDGLVGSLRPDEVDDYGTIWISSTVLPSLVGTAATSWNVPVGTHEAYLLDELGLASSSGRKSDEHSVRLPDGNLLRVYSSNQSLTWGTIGPGGEILASQDTLSSRATIAFFGKGAELTDGTAARNCRAWHFLTDYSSTRLTDAGWATFDVLLDDLLSCSSLSVPTVEHLPDRTDEEFAVLSIPVMSSVDPDRVSVTGLPAGLTYDTTTGRIVGEISGIAARPTPYDVFIAATTEGDTVTATTFRWFITDGPNRPPVVEHLGPLDVTVGDDVEIVIDASDPNGDELSFEAWNLPAGLSLRPDGLIIGTVVAGNGSTPVTSSIEVMDSYGAGSEITLTWLINESPSLDGIVDQYSTELDEVGLALNATDPNGDPMTFTATGLPDGLAIDSMSGAISGTITGDAARFSPYDVEVEVADDRGAHDSVNFIWNVAAGPNQPPALAGPDRLLLTEGTSTSALFVADDPDGDELTFSATNLPPGLHVDSSTGALIGAPGLGSADAGDAVATVTVTDPEGAIAQIVVDVSVRRVHVTDVIEDVGQRHEARVSSFGRPCVADLNGDSFLDTIWSLHKYAPWSYYLGGEDGFVESDEPFIKHDNHGCLAGDFDNDGDLDLIGLQGACQGNCSKRDRFWRNRGDGTFARVDWLIGPYTMDRSRIGAVLDVDNDGWMDVLIVAQGSTNGSSHKLLVNKAMAGNSWSGFEIDRTGLGEASGEATCAGTIEADGDGWMDMYICQDGRFDIYLNVGGTPTLSDLAADLDDVLGAQAADVDGDGDDDLLVARESAFEVRLNDGGRFDEVTFSHPLLAGHEVATPDIDADGDLDVIVVQATSGHDPWSDGAHMLFVNVDGTGTSWSRAALPQPPEGAGDKATVFPNFDGAGRDAVLIGNGGNWDTKGPRQWLAMNPSSV